MDQEIDDCRECEHWHQAEVTPVPQEQLDKADQVAATGILQGGRCMHPFGDGQDGLDGIWVNYGRCRGFMMVSAHVKAERLCAFPELSISE